MKLVLLLVALAAIGIGVAVNARDIRRYLKMRHT
jgi:hypothetical protein